MTVPSLETMLLEFLRGLLFTVVAALIVARDRRTPSATKDSPRLLLPDGTTAQQAKTRWYSRAAPYLLLLIPIAYALVRILVQRASVLGWYIFGDAWYRTLGMSTYTWLLSAAFLATTCAVVSKRIWGRHSLQLYSLLALMLTAYVIVPTQLEGVVGEAEGRAYEVGVAMIERGEFTEARHQLIGLVESNRLGPEWIDNVHGRLAQIAFKEGRYVDAADYYARIIGDYPDTDIKESLELSIYWSMYELALRDGLEDSLRSLVVLRERYPELDFQPIWLVLDPPTWQAALSSPWNHWLRSTELLSDDEANRVQAMLSALGDDDEYALSRTLGLATLGDFASASESAPTIELRQAFAFQAAEAAYSGRDFEDALLLYDEYEEEYPQSAVQDDLLMRRARIFEITYRYDDAIQCAVEAMTAPDGDELRDSELLVCYLIEGADVATIERLASQHSPAWPEALREGIFRRLVSSGSYQAALDYDDVARIGSLFDRQAILSLLEPRDAVSLSSAAAALDSDTGLIYNSSWRLQRSGFIHWRSCDAEYAASDQEFSMYLDDFPLRYDESVYLEQNPRVQAARVYEASLRQTWDYDTACALLDAYAHLSADTSFLGSDETRLGFCLEAESLAEVIEKRADVDTDQKAHVRSTLAQIGLLGVGTYDLDWTIKHFEILVERYPQSNLANNALVWVAWCYERRSREFEPGSEAYLQCYERAAATYERILRDYPTGHVASEARDSLREASAVLAAWDS